MIKMKVVKIDDEAYYILEELSKKTQMSIKDLVTKAVTLLYKGEENVTDKEIKDISEKIITLKYPSRCRRCGKELKEGDYAYYIRYTYSDETAKALIYCLECYHETIITDKALAKLYLKKKELEKIINVLRKEADELSNTILVNRKLEEVREYFDRSQKLVQDILKALMNTNGNEVSIEKIDELNRILEDLRKVVSELSMLRLKNTNIKVYKIQSKYDRW